MTTTYSTTADLLIGDLQLGALLDPQKAVEDAYREMNSRIGMVYELPLPVSAMPQYLQDLLNLINNRLASGRLLLAAALAGESKELHAYGQSLVDMAFCDLANILNGTIDLEGCIRRGDTDRNAVPRVIGADATSPVDAFERFAYGDSWACPDPPWRPGR